MARALTLADLRAVARRRGWFEALGPGDEALFVLAEDERTSVLHALETGGTLRARAVTRERLDMRARRAEAGRVAQPNALRGILDSERAAAFLEQKGRR